MLGRLARWLRILGYDTRYERDIDDRVLLEEALSENRIILTRDTGITKIRTNAHIIFLESEKPRFQLQQLMTECGISLDRERLFSRCSWCNQILEDVDKADAAGKVPPYVFATEKRFRHCRHCDKIYWRGTHQGRFLTQLFKNGPSI